MSMAVVSAVSVAFSVSVSAAELMTGTYHLEIESKCGEGNVTCESILMTGQNKHSGEPVTLTGETWHTVCADGSPCRFLGYRFFDGELTYFIHQSGLLEVIAGDRDLKLSEQGEWRD